MGGKSGHAALCFLLWISALALGAHAQSLDLPKLPYEYDALEPHFDEATMKVHHLGHHQTYTTTTNGILTALRSESRTKHLAKMGIDKLLQHIRECPEGLQQALRNAGGGFVNHALFWPSLTPKPAPAPVDTPLGKAIVRDFGSVLDLQNQFNEVATRVFGSGWAWLVYDEATGKLSVEGTANQDTPAMTKGKVVMFGLDVWEHAYYLKYQNKRVAYIDAFWKVLHWNEIERRFKVAENNKTKGGEL